MTKHLGLGVMISMLVGNEATVNALAAVANKEIASVCLADNGLRIAFVDGTGIDIWDDGQDCCELRYMSTDDDLAAHIGAELRKVEVREAPDAPAEYDVHEVQFLVVTTSKGRFTMETHNEHNGYYGGFSLKAKLTEVASQEVVR